MQSPLTGLIAATYTPMQADGALNLEMVAPMAAWLMQQRIAAAFVCGTTGESLSLTLAERKAVAERWRREAGDALPVIVHVGHPCLADAQELAAHAEQIGARAIAAMAPSFFKPATPDDLIAFCAELAAAAPKTPFYYYHIPSMTGVNFAMADVLARVKDRIPNFAGMKFTGENLMDFGRCLRFDGGRYDMLFGRDEILLSALTIGARGAVGSTYNYAAPIYQRVLAAFASGDLCAAREAQATAYELVAALQPFNGVAAQKAIMKMCGFDCGPVRLPLRNLSDAEYVHLRQTLERIGFFATCGA